MNERIKELAEQAREYANSSQPYEKIKNKAWIDVYDEKFAELIIDEVLQVIAVSDSKCCNEWDFAERDIYVEIQKHFGVE